MSTAQPVDHRLFSSIDPLALAGSRCTECGTTTFPAQADCPRCARRTMEPTALPSEGVLWTWTVQTFEPKPPYTTPQEGFVPFPVGYVDLGDIMVEARLAADPTELAVGVRMVLVPFTLTNGTDEPVLGYAFAPAPRGAA